MKVFHIIWQKSVVEIWTYTILWENKFGPWERTLKTSPTRNTMEQELSTMLWKFSHGHDIMSIMLTVDESKGKINTDMG